MDKKIKTTITAVIVVAIVVFSVYTVYDLNGKSLDLSDRQVRIIVTGSMDGEPQDYDIPTIPVNSLVMIENLSYDEVANDLKIGDVIAFNSGGILITHRIIAIDYDLKTITTKGDANLGTETVAFTNVVGIIVGVNHWLGFVVHIFQDFTLTVVLATIGIVSGVVAVKSSLKIMREEKQEEAERAEREKLLQKES